MNITPIKNIRLQDNTLICDQPKGICVSNFLIEFDSPVSVEETDHCECITMMLEVCNNIMLVLIATDKTGIDEFIIIRITQNEITKTIKLKYQR